MTTLAPPNQMTIRLAEEFGPVLVGRATGGQIRSRIEQAAQCGGDPIVLDFEAILTVSPSFADELFAKLDPAVRQRLEVRSMEPGLESITRFVVAGRLSDT